MRKRRSNLSRVTRDARRARARRAKWTEEEILRDNEKRRLKAKLKRSQETEEERRERLSTNYRRTKQLLYSRKSKPKLQRINEIVEKVKIDKTIKTYKKKQFSKAVNTMYQLQYTFSTVENEPKICQIQSSTSLAEKTATATSNTELSEPPSYWSHIDIKSECEDNQWMNGTQIMEETNNIDAFNSMDGSSDYKEYQSTPEPNVKMENESIITEQITNESPIEIKPEIMDNIDDESYIVPDNEIIDDTEVNTDINTFQSIQYNAETNSEINCNIQTMIYKMQNFNGTNGTFQRLNGTGLENNGSIPEKIDILDKTSVDPSNLMVISDKKKWRHKKVN